jgi:hypothetical protein
MGFFRLRVTSKGYEAFPKAEEVWLVKILLQMIRIRARVLRKRIETQEIIRS